VRDVARACRATARIAYRGEDSTEAPRTSPISTGAASLRCGAVPTPRRE
jgi:hypothetical protein